MQLAGIYLLHLMMARTIIPFMGNTIPFEQAPKTTQLPMGPNRQMANLCIRHTLDGSTDYTQLQ